MFSLLSDTAIRIPCFNCSTMIVKPMEWVKNHNCISCKCGTSIDLNTQQLKSEIAIDELSYANLKVML